MVGTGLVTSLRLAVRSRVRFLSFFEEGDEAGLSSVSPGHLRALSELGFLWDP